MAMRVATMSIAAAVSAGRLRGLRALFSTRSPNLSIPFPQWTEPPQSTIVAEALRRNRLVEKRRWEHWEREITSKWEQALNERANLRGGNRVPRGFQEIRSPSWFIMDLLPKFKGVPGEDPNIYLAKFHDVCDSLKDTYDDVNNFKFWAFPASLRGEARSWFSTLEPGSIDSWDELQQVFLDKYLPKGDEFKKSVKQEG